jgi:V8-like Glu-specific endopeptidase
MASTVTLNGPDKNNQPTQIGSGYYIGDDLVLTAGHVVYAFNEKDHLSDRQIKNLTTITPSSLDTRNYYSLFSSEVMTLSDPLPIIGTNSGDSLLNP